MLKNFPVKVDSVGRLVIPKEIRDRYKIDKESMYFIDNDDSILLKKIDSIVQIDSYGRILIPKKLRNKFSICENSSVLLSASENGLIIMNDYNRFKSLIDKLVFIENRYNVLSLIYEKELVIYASDYLLKSEETVLDFDNLNLDNDFNVKKICFGDKEDVLLLLIYKNTNQDIISLITKLII